MTEIRCECGHREVAHPNGWCLGAAPNPDGACCPCDKFVAATATVSIIRCPSCELLMSRMENVPITEHWTEWRCWDCGHAFGGYSTLDLGLVAPPPAV